MTQALQVNYPSAQIYGVDFAKERLHQAAAQGCLPIGSLAQSLPILGASIDLLILNDVLHWLNDVPAVLQECQRVLKPGGLLMLTTLGPASLQEWRQAYQAVGQVPRVHNFADMHDVGDALVHAGFADPVMDREDLKVRYDSLRQMLKDIREQGASFALEGQAPRGLQGKCGWQQLLAAYPKVGADYFLQLELIQGHAWRDEAGAHRANEAGEVMIGLQHLRQQLLGRRR
jgi:malonyl-CoA O-methyltransferase